MKNLNAMKKGSGGIDRFEERGILNAGRTQIGKAGMHCAGTADMDGELPFEDIIAIRRVDREMREEAKRRMVWAAIVFLVVSILLAAALVAFT